jgi:hypothetical protein
MKKLFIIILVIVTFIILLLFINILKKYIELNENFYKDDEIIDDYIKKYDQLNKIIVYNFNIGDGGIGDCIKYFIFVLQICIKNNYKLYYQINNIELEKYLKLKYHQMYIKKDDMKNINEINNINDIENISSDKYYIVKPQLFYKKCNYDNINLNGNQVFYFSNKIKKNSKTLLSPNISSYISLHLRLGDKYLEIDKKFIDCKTDTRKYSEEKIFDFIKKNSKDNIVFFCDNNNYRKKIKEKYNNIIITNSEIGHSSLSNTTNKQILDAVTEFYLLTKSEKIYCGAESGFSIIASKFNNIPLIKLF